ncbi:MAG: ABC transporter permease subunit [Gammaproteobacteria bacterium]|nr:ABC transporter permease subunit [Gammaproteobacteria bacterium]
MSENKALGKHYGKSAVALTGMFSKGPAKPGDSYGAPGQGRSVVISIVTSIVLFLAWYLITATGLIKPLFLPPPSAILDRLTSIMFEPFGGGTLWEHTWASLVRVFGAFFLACITAIPIGVLMGVNRVVRGVFDPPIEFYRPIPPLAYLPLMVIWFGIGELTKIIIIFLAVFAPMALNARAGVRSVSMEQIHAAYSMGASRAQVIWHVILKGAMPEILTGMRIGIGFGWTTLVAAELVAAQQGLGAMIQQASDFLVTDVAIMGIIVIGVIAYLFDLLMRYIERMVVPWKGKM